MVDLKNVQKQLRKIKFGASPWNQAELRELPHILHEHEKISECVNGYYEGGVALLVATNMRLLLIDKKPLNYLNVEDLRFDMINEIDYSHRLVGATITIATGSKTLKFKSYNQQRLRNLITQVQERMSLMKKEESDKTKTQQQHLEEINKQLQMYLLAQHQQLQQQIATQNQPPTDLSLPKPSAQLSDYLFAQRLMQKFEKDNGGAPQSAPINEPPIAIAEPLANATIAPEPAPITQEDLVADAKKEVFGHHVTDRTLPVANVHPSAASTQAAKQASLNKGIEINPITIAYSKLPMMLRNRKFGRPSLHAHSQQQQVPTGQVVPQT